MHSNWQSVGREWLKRGTDQHLRIAVTGLRQSGKTTLVTALIDALLNWQKARLPMWEVAASGRLLGCEQSRYDLLHIPTFPYPVMRDKLANGQWPQATETLNEIRLTIRYQPKGSFRQKLTPHRDLLVDLFDYPGEWLLDLPLLEQSYQQWSDNVRRNLESDPLAEPFLRKLSALDPSSNATDIPIKEITEDYRQYLVTSRKQGGYWLTPGRQLLPGELKDAPVLDFFPWVGKIATNDKQYSKHSCFKVLRQRYDYYRSHIVTPFYKEHFSRFDRQVVLVDVLDALNHGPVAVSQLQKALSEVLKSFNYGRRSLLNRLFSPRVDKVVFAATQADRITMDQYPSLSLLIDDLLANAMGRLRFNGIDYQTMVTSAVVATEQGKIQNKPALRGKELSSGQWLNVFPGGVPKEVPEPHFWNTHQFEYPSFSPIATPMGSPMKHMRLDALLEYLIGDKLV